MAASRTYDIENRADVQTTPSRRFGAMDWISMALLIVGGLNWGLVGIADFDLVATLFGDGSALSRIVYVLVGLAALYSLYTTTKMGRRLNMSKAKARTADALQLLKDDHDKVKEAFRQFEKMDRSDVATCRELVTSVCADLRVHSMLEEEILYPAVREAIDDEDLMSEAVVEHDTADMLIEQLERMEPEDPNYFATFTVLGEYVDHHVEEEEGEMFPQARKAKSLDLAALGERILSRKQELSAEMEQA